MFGTEIKEKWKCGSGKEKVGEKFKKKKKGKFNTVFKCMAKKEIHHRLSCSLELLFHVEDKH